MEVRALRPRSFAIIRSEVILRTGPCALSETGGFHIETLHLNRPQLIAYRVERRLLEAARQNHGQPLERLRRLEEEVQSLTAQLAQLEREDFNA